MELLHAGLDIGSTTAKAVVLDEYDKIIFYRYSRHFADIRTAVERTFPARFDDGTGAGLNPFHYIQVLSIPCHSTRIVAIL